MRIFYTLMLLACSGNFAFGQFTYYDLSGNNVNATISNNGLFFNQTETSSHGYEAPAGSGNHLIYSMGFWFGGEDINGQMKLAAQTYMEEGDLFRGPLTNDGSAEAPESSEAFTVFPCTKEEIDYHIANIGEVGYMIPESILNWPAHGDVGSGVDFYLAPFHDADGDGIYDPTAGDYPMIKGDHAVYVILNDKADLHETGSDPIGLEIHYLFYQYDSEPGLEDVTFINMKLINRGTQTIYNFRTGCYLDPDIGYGEDDFVGSSEEKNMMFAYNGFNNDPGGYGQPGYGDNPPALGVQLLNREAYSVMSYSSAAGPYGAPTSPVDYYNYMGATWKNGAHLTEGGTGYMGEDPTNFIYDGNPNDLEEWSELSVANPPGDRRILISTQHEVLEPFQIMCFDYAVLYNRDGDHLENVQGLLDMADDVKAFYDSQTPYCMSGVSSVPKEEISELSIYPNPSNGSFTVQMEGTYELELFSMDGRLVYTENNCFGNTIVEADLVPGTYLAIITQDNVKHQSKLVIKK